MDLLAARINSHEPFNASCTLSQGKIISQSHLGFRKGLLKSFWNPKEDGVVAKKAITNWRSWVLERHMKIKPHPANGGHIMREAAKVQPSRNKLKEELSSLCLDRNRDWTTRDKKDELSAGALKNYRLLPRESCIKSEELNFANILALWRERLSQHSLTLPVVIASSCKTKPEHCCLTSWKKKWSSVRVQR